MILQVSEGKATKEKLSSKERQKEELWASRKRGWKTQKAWRSRKVSQR